MKKVLFATTALVATAGMAAADVTFGGYGRFGLIYRENATGSDETNITHRFRLQIDATAESDSGISFGARVRIQRNAGDSGEIGTNGARFFARSGSLEVGVGNIFGALEFMPGQYPIDLGLTGLGYDYTAYNFRGAAYSSGGDGSSNTNGVEVIYSAGAFGVHASYDEPTSGNDRLAAHVSYTTNGWTFALGAQDSDTATDTEWTVSAAGSLGVADVTVAYADNGTDGDHWVVAGRFDVGASTNVEAYVADADYFADTSYGVDFNHNLGGGTSLRGGIAHRQSGDINADFGVRFNF